ncbi:glutathione S-transferase family protein [Burkholderia pseudomultivorans]|uniref:Stringent starvation protein A n=1 Tax=Burkholderia pseudomultivorans TaxID=1207504 RepID=A0ABU2DWH8_9BURK|nr:glutathione S-transferase family protein [Burkholderia pseudomultivorans]MDR8727214.1 Stringent starvation protein A [Burkholderia pseudomultivorans]MDR8734874.1 Stringent starvation protein A [Burkholderia pseudomultivorans]MDR8740857.1 Stringent starvation protein A [Burkholderia pseudomultivorans]MDR8751945.1 Stringent starvation protein A [Burkholderia pseudomultivorans]MDR8777271.1 Stringent starvation protein A [Burkholderia pseudomultivorans]
MMPTLYAHPFSSYCQKVLTALYENGTPFDYRLLPHDDPKPMQELAALWPMKRFPVLVDAGRTIIEATIIVEYLGLKYPGPVRLLPEDPNDAIEVRMMDRFFDNYVATPQQKVVFDALRPQAERDARGVADARAMLEKSYAWLDAKMADREWATGDRFSLADCGAAPFLFYADWTHRIDPSFANVIAYRKRLLARPSFARAVDEARPFRSFFPLGAPDRD